MNLVCNARLAVTDSGGIQEETTYLNIPCLTLRENTERPITVTQGTNRLVRPDTLADMVERVLNGELRGARRPALRSEEHTSELQSLMRISYAVFCLKKKK